MLAVPVLTKIECSQLTKMSFSATLEHDRRGNKVEFLPRPNCGLFHLYLYNIMQGTVTSKNEEKGFGFITVEGQDDKVFFHSSSLQGIAFPEVMIGDMVTFDSEKTEKGLRATAVSKA